VSIVLAIGDGGDGLPASSPRSTTPSSLCNASAAVLIVGSGETWLRCGGFYRFAEGEQEDGIGFFGRSELYT
jgi:hypothetical protein